MFHFEKFSRDVGLPTAPIEDKHAREGWINVPCPFCTGNPGYHLGWNQGFGYFRCWRCGKHDVVTAISKLCGVSTSKARQYVAQYQTKEGRKFRTLQKQKNRAEVCQLPEACGKIEGKALKYLLGRGFDEYDIELWGLKQTHPATPFRHRIFIPYHFDGQLVTWQCRDYSGKTNLKYLACEKEKAVLDVKETLYGIDQARNYDNVIVLEGVTDVWNVGPGSVATSGTSWVMEQALLLLDWKKQFIFFDPNEEEAAKNAERLSITLNGLGGDSEVIQLDGFDGDPGDLPQSLVAELRELCGLPLIKR